MKTINFDFLSLCFFHLTVVDNAGVTATNGRYDSVQDIKHHVFEMQSKSLNGTKFRLEFETNNTNPFGNILK